MTRPRKFFKTTVHSKGPVDWWWACTCRKKSKTFRSGAEAHGSADAHRKTHSD